MLLVTMVAFNQSLYRVGEDDGSVKITLVLSKPLSYNIIVQVVSMDDSARGMDASIVID